MNYLLYQGLSEITAETCGAAILYPGWSHPVRNINTSVLILGRYGRVVLKEDSEELTIEPKKICILNAGHSHKGVEELKEPARYYWAHFKSENPGKPLTEVEANMILNHKEVIDTRLKDALLLPQQFSCSQYEEVQESFHELLYEYKNPSFTGNKFQALFKLLLIRLNELVIKKHISLDKFPAKRGIVYKIIQLVYENMTDRNFSVKILADKMNYNSDYLCRLFKSVMYKSIQEYLIDKRIEYSTNLLIESNDTVDNISNQSGFASSRNFVRQFKARKGRTPSEQRLRHRTMHLTNK